MKLGITGAYGFLGAAITAQALAAGYEVVAFASRRKEHPLFSNGDVETRSLRLGTDTAIDLTGIDSLIHAAGATSFRAADRRAVWDANVLGSRALYEAALERGLSRFVDLSSVNALGSVDGIPADETSAAGYSTRYPSVFLSPQEALAAADASAKGEYAILRRSKVTYFDSKMAACELSKRYARERGLPLVTVFPGTAVGPGDLNHGIARFVDMVWEGRLAMAPAGSTTYMDSRDFARGVIAALERGRVGEGYILAGKPEDTMSYAAFMGRINGLALREGLPRRRAFRPLVLPPLLAYAGASIAEALVPGLGLYSALALSGAIRQEYRSDKARAELGYDPATPLDVSICACREFSLRHGERLQ